MLDTGAESMKSNTYGLDVSEEGIKVDKVYVREIKELDKTMNISDFARLLEQVEEERVNNKTIGEIIQVLKMVIDMFDVLESIVCDNSPFNNDEFEKFTKHRDIEPSFNSPYHSQSSGMVEKTVEIAKALFKKTYEGNNRLTVTFIEYRNIPISGIGHLLPTSYLIVEGELNFM
ncbi:uncharacterized protein K02A2.6 [Nephila pilipes]|uniref:Uncharacterized protein K02A2.6 n=1 Tax=Nephila pilipes TaxID=299642 RepID=A0A8X6ITY6_NEPPI|nr:uncharacterized protein K02A2.6 [Nephila pilipes]